MSVLSHYLNKLKKWFAKQNSDELVAQALAFVKAAVKISGLTNDQKTAWVVSELAEYCANNGINISETEVRLVVSIAVAEWKKLFADAAPVADDKVV